MSANSFGQLFRITTFGESHGSMIGVVIDGCPAGLLIDHDHIRHELDRRRPGQSPLTSQRHEDDAFEIVSGIYENTTTGAPLTIIIRNKDIISSDYDIYKDVFRPSHADYTWFQKFGIRDHRGGGRSSARETAVRVAAGAVAKQFLRQHNILIYAYTHRIGRFVMEDIYLNDKKAAIEESVVRCPDKSLSNQMISLIEELKKEGNSIGGEVCCIIRNCPAGLGEPVYDKLDADLAKAMLSINACKGFEIGAGFGAATLKGSENIDKFTTGNDGNIGFQSNHAGGVLGGMSTGQDIWFKAAFKPTSTIEQNKDFVNAEGEQVILENKGGRHDPCVVPRAVPIVEAMAALVIADHLLRNRSAVI